MTPNTDEEVHDYQERIEKMMMMTVAAAKGIVPRGQVILPFLQIANGTLAPLEIRDFAKVLVQVVNGERDISIATHLPPDLFETIQTVFERIEAPLPDATETEREGLSLLELLERVGEACTGNMLLWQQLWDFTEELENASSTPANIKALAVVLRKILAGERQKHILTDLSPELADPVNMLLDQLLMHTPSPPDVNAPTQTHHAE